MRGRGGWAGGGISHSGELSRASGTAELSLAFIKYPVLAFNRISLHLQFLKSEFSHKPQAKALHPFSCHCWQLRWYWWYFSVAPTMQPSPVPSFGADFISDFPALWKLHFHCDSRITSFDIGLCGNQASKILGYLSTSTCMSMGRNKMQLLFMNQAPASAGAQGGEIWLGHDPTRLLLLLHSCPLFSLILLPLQTGQSVPWTGATQRCREQQVWFGMATLLNQRRAGTWFESQIQVRLRKIKDESCGVTIQILQRRCPHQRHSQQQPWSFPAQIKTPTIFKWVQGWNVSPGKITLLVLLLNPGKFEMSEGPIHTGVCLQAWIINAG